MHGELFKISLNWHWQRRQLSCRLDCW